jgi:peptide deformylase
MAPAVIIATLLRRNTATMSKLTILEYPDPRLRTRAAPVSLFDDALRRLAGDMLETMYAAPGVGLAATQVNIHQRLLVADVSEERNQPQILVNPEILSQEGIAVREEGCLSVPGIFDEVERAARIQVRAQDVDGKTFELNAEGLLAVCIQHEIDHLNGKLFVDYLSELKRERIRKKLEKERKQRESGDDARPRARTPAI